MFCRALSDSSQVQLLDKLLISAAVLMVPAKFTAWTDISSYLIFLTGSGPETLCINPHSGFQLFISDDHRPDRYDIILYQYFQCALTFYTIHLRITLGTLLKKSSSYRAVNVPFIIIWSHRFLLQAIRISFITQRIKGKSNPPDELHAAHSE